MKASGLARPEMMQVRKDTSFIIDGAPVRPNYFFNNLFMIDVFRAELF